MIAQSSDAKRDYIWRTGYNTRTDYKFNTTVNFHYIPTKVDSIFKKQPNHGQVGMICNTGGDFLLFSNGCQISNQADQVIIGTVNMNRGDVHTVVCPPNGDGMLFPQSMMILPQPNDTNTFFCFYLNSRWSPVVTIYTDQLLLTKLVKDPSNAFRVLLVDSVIITDILENSHLTACRHANGRDWWILHSKAHTNKYYQLLLTPHQTKITTQNIGVLSTDFENGGGQAVFAPDGSKYVRYNIDSDIRIFDFDRCSGILSNPVQIPIVDASDSVGFAGCAISPNSRWLYIISTDKIYQFDLHATNIAATKTTILVYDGGVHPTGLRYTFAQGQLGPDGKIYVSNTGGRDALHIIEAPDSAGVACRAIQRRFKLTDGISFALPYFPNFRLGALKGSPCDTLQKEAIGNYDFKCYPNPVVDDQLTIELTMPHYDHADLEVELWDLMGRRVSVTRFAPFTSIHQVAVESFASGMYLITLKVNQQPILTKKITILH